MLRLRACILLIGSRIACVGLLIWVVDKSIVIVLTEDRTPSRSHHFFCAIGCVGTNHGGCQNYLWRVPFKVKKHHNTRGTQTAQVES
jgi:hypothetical protein